MKSRSYFKVSMHMVNTKTGAEFKQSYNIYSSTNNQAIREIHNWISDICISPRRYTLVFGLGAHPDGEQSMILQHLTERSNRDFTSKVKQVCGLNDSFILPLRYADTVIQFTCEHHIPEVIRSGKPNVYAVAKYNKSPSCLLTCTEYGEIVDFAKQQQNIGYSAACDCILEPEDEEDWYDDDDDLFE